MTRDGRTDAGMRRTYATDTPAGRGDQADVMYITIDKTEKKGYYTDIDIVG